MIKKLTLTNFKAFERFTTTFGDRAFLVGPNNAGKSTVIAALRAAASMLRIATHARATDTQRLDGVSRTGHVFSSGQLGLEFENLPHEFRQVETALRVVFARGVTLDAVWQPGDPSGGFFCLREEDFAITRPGDVRRVVPSVGLVPVLSPLEHDEDVLSPKHVKSNLDTRLASRHFRNQLHALRQQSTADGNGFDDFRAFADSWLSELRLLRLNLNRVGGLDLYYSEPRSRIDKEIFWAGDGVQIWLQLLLHVFRHQRADVLVLDEPDVFLHADLQHRLVDLLDSLSSQTITATHSAEVLAAAPRDAVIWVSRDRVRGVRSPSPETLVGLSDALGSAFNLRLAKALRAKVVLFVEGEDMEIIRALARRLGADRVVRETGIAVIPLLGFDRWEHVEPFQWMVNHLLEGAVSVHVLLDRDYNLDSEVSAVERRLHDVGVTSHVWAQKELENYLLVPSAIARSSGAPESEVARLLDEAIAAQEIDFHANIYQSHRRCAARRLNDTTVHREATQYASALWADVRLRRMRCSGKRALADMNRLLQSAGYKAVTHRGIVNKMRVGEIAEEMRSEILRIDALGT